MTDLLSIGSSGINVYQRALSTVSNNIANLNTEGYSRQTTEIRQNQPVEVGKGFVGTGAYFDRVSRQYDSFLESSLQQATSDLEAQGAAVEYTNRLLDVLGDEDVGLTTALNRFFSSAKALSGDPASPALRGVMLRESEALASRFNGLSGQLTDLRDQSLSALEADVRSVNALSEQIAEVNRQMLKKRSALDQAPELLDRRDQLLRDLSEYVQIRTAFDQKGSVTVSLADSTNKGLVVSGNKSSSLEITPSTADVNQLTVSLQGELSNETLTQIPSGSVAGFARFYEETLVNVNRSLDTLARVFVDEVNAIQTAGLDGNGELGSTFFEIQPTFQIDKGASLGDFDVQVVVDDPENYVPEAIQLTFDGIVGRWYTEDGEGAKTYATQQGVLELDRLRVQISGQPQVGDQLTLNPEMRAAAGIGLAIQDGIQIATASLFRATPASTNNGVFDPKVIFDAQPPIAQAKSQILDLQGDRSQSIVPSQFEPMTVIPAGQTKTSLFFDPESGSNNVLQIMTSNGQHIVGSQDIGDASALLKTSSQFSESAVFGSAYLNQSGLTGYKDWDIFYGAEATASEVTEVLPATGLIFETPEGSDFSGGGLNLTLTPVAPGDQLDLRHQAFADPTLGVVSVVDDVLYVGQGESTLQIGEIATTYDGTAQTLGIQFLSDLQAGLIDDDLASRVAALVTYSSGADLRTGVHPEQRLLTSQLFSRDRSVLSSVSREFATQDLVDAGLFTTTDSAYRAVLETGPVDYAAGAGRVLIEAGDIELNGVALDDLVIDDSGVLSAATVQDWLDSAGTPVTVAASNRIEISPDQLKLSDGVGLSINEVTILAPSTGSETRFDDMTDLIAGINAQAESSGVFASTSENGNLILQNLDLSGANIAIAGATSGQGINTLGIAEKSYLGRLQLSLDSAQGDAIQLSLGEHGRPSDLNRLGLSTEVRITGQLDEDLLVFMGGSGSAEVRAETVESEVLFTEGLRARRFEVEFVAEDRYQITDLTTNTVVADRAYAGETILSYQGMQIELDRMPVVGDAFTIDGNNLGPGGTFDAQGNNSNVLRFVDLESDEVLDGGLTISEGYLRFVGDVGNMATQSDIARDALQIVKTQAVEARDRVSGVNLDKEAADLIRFQQAYQASAQVMQVATRLFDAMLQIR